MKRPQPLNKEGKKGIKIGAKIVQGGAVVAVGAAVKYVKDHKDDLLQLGAKIGARIIKK